MRVKERLYGVAVTRDGSLAIIVDLGVSISEARPWEDRALLASTG